MSSVYDLSGGSSALQNLNRVAQFSRQVRDRVGATFPTANLPEGAGSSVSSASGGATPLSLTQSRALVASTNAAVDTILSSLTQIQDLVTQAQAPDYNSGIGATAATASSRVNIQARIQSLVAGIDSAVKSASVDNSNLIDGRKASVVLSTTALGGQITAAVQSLGSAGLGLSGLDVTSDAGVQDALSRVSSAVGTASLRAQNLQSLGRVFQDQTAFVSNVAASLAQSGGGLLAHLSGYGAQGQSHAQPASGRGSVVSILA